MDNPNNKLITKTEVENILNYFQNIGDGGTRLKISNLENFQRAFVHESYYQAVQNAIINRQVQPEKTYITYIPEESNERLEYLGDHILKSTLSRYLFERFGEEREGFLTKLKIKIEKCSMLHKIGVTLGFQEFLLLSLQVENQTVLDLDRGRMTPSYYEDAFEAILGSIMIEFGERGYLYADRFVRSVIENIIDFAEIISHNENYKDSLQRKFQSVKWNTPVYISLTEDGPLYRKVFTRMLVITGEQYDQLDKEIQKRVDKYNNSVCNQYKRSNPSAFEKMFGYVKNGNYVLGIGFGRKVVQSEQSCAKQCMDIMGLPQDY
jgi:dsRNA-specific ribonuclease